MIRFAWLIGLFTIAAAALDWDWFFNNSKAKFFVNAFGRNGARVFYGLVGVVIMLLGLIANHPWISKHHG